MSISTPTAIMPLQSSTASAPVSKKDEPLDKAHADLKKASQGFEAYFVDQLFKEMRKSIPKDDLLGDSDHQQETFQDMMDQKVADQVAQKGSFGISDMLYRELSLGLPPNNPEPTAANKASTAAKPEPTPAETHPAA